LAIFAATLHAQGGDSFSGTFTVTGTNPGGAGGYQGTLNIQKREEVYEATWTISNGQKFEGVGVVVDGNLSVGYWASDKSWTGIVVYKAKSDGSLSGIWGGLGQGRTGTEKAIRSRK
jgi:hypothetical protein